MEQKTNIKLKLCTLNCRGLRTESKRKKVLYWLKSKSFDIICLQETYFTQNLVETIKREWGGQLFHSLSNSVHARGVSVLIKPHLDVNVLSSFRDNEGRRLLVNCKLNADTIITIFNVYAPVALAHRIDFLKRTSKWVKQSCTSETMLLVSGDFNCIYRTQDRTSGNLDSSGKHFLDLQKYNNLHDLFVKLHPNMTSGFTWTDPANSNHKSRIDYILASNHLCNLTANIQTVPTPVSDHIALTATFDHISKLRGPGYWKLNTNLLKDPTYINLVKTIIAKTKEEYIEILDSRSLWELVKIKIKENSIKYSIKKSRARHSKVNEIENRLKQIDTLLIQNTSDKVALSNESKILKKELDDHYTYKARGHQVRSRAKWIEEGERSSSYFLRLEKKRQTFNQIDSLVTENGQIARTNDEILATAYQFYSKLYSSTNPAQNAITTYLQNTKFENKLNDLDKLTCEGQITCQECQFAVKCLKDNKSPGIDGLSSEFYKQFWEDIEEMLIKSYNESFNKGLLTDSQRTSILSLIFKKNDRTMLQNYRPISLATTDYKILAFVLANRLHKVISKIVSNDQTGYIRKRFIGTNIRLVTDIIDYAEQYNLGGAILFLDFEKAFDSIEWSFMLSTLNSFNFGPDFINWIKIMYKQPVALVKNNGWLSAGLALNRGIRQGCPLSALIFILAVEILALNIKQANTIQGFHIRKGNATHEVKMSQYADDSILILRDGCYIPEALKLLDSYGVVSGLKLNIPKTEGLWLGKDKDNPDHHYGIHFTKAPIRCLGIYIGHDKQACYKKNWTDKIEKFQRLLDSWRTRDLTLFGKVLIIKSLGISQLTFSAMCCTSTIETEKEIMKIIYQFLWHSRERIKRRVLINCIDEGGINMIDVESFFGALKASWVNRLSEQNNCSWKLIPLSYFENISPNFSVFQMNFDRETIFPIIKNIPEFYTQVLINYNKSKLNTLDSIVDNLGDQIIWGNKFFLETKSNGKKICTLYFKHWISSGIIYIKNLLFVNGKIDENFIYNKIQNKRNIYIEIQLLKKALHPYHQHFNQVHFTNDLSDINTAKLQAINPSVSVTKHYYNNIISKFKQSASLHKWGETLHIDISQEIKTQVFSRKIVKIKENKIKEFNYKVLHNILACNNLLSKWVAENNGRCEICQCKDDIYHLIFDCQLAQTVWNIVSAHLNYVITDEDVIFGTNNPNMNYFISFIAFLIYKYWLICSKNNEQRTILALKLLIRNDLFYKSQSYKFLKKEELSNILQNLSSCF